MSGKDDGAYMAPERKPHPMREDVARRCAVNFRYWLNRTTMQQLPPWPLMRDDMRQRFLEEADRILSLFDGENALRLRFTCPLCGTLNAPTRGDVVVGDRYQCSECGTALVFSVASPEVDAMHGDVFAPASGEPSGAPVDALYSAAYGAHSVLAARTGDAVEREVLDELTQALRPFVRDPGGRLRIEAEPSGAEAPEGGGMSEEKPRAYGCPSIACRGADKCLAPDVCHASNSPTRNKEPACPKHCWHTKYGRGGAGGDVCCHCGKSRELIVDKEHGPHNPNKVWEP